MGNANELRRAFVDHFTALGHTEVASAGLIPHHPSAPMFTNSGMMPFVPYFLGEEAVPWKPPRAVSVQKCVRAGGKHNDLDAIGRSPRHLSFFEMLGNFSFGDYFKEDAIRWAWSFLTGTLGLDGDRMWVTVHTSDDDAEAIWIDTIGFPEKRIQRCGEDNFWEMGETGPCGPSSEIFWDNGPEYGPDGGPANAAAEDRFVELWNLVFQQQFRHPDGSLTDLTTRNIDTGAGLERILAVLSGSPWLYVADTLADLVSTAEDLTGRRLGDDPSADVALRLLADHARTMTFLVADGVIPSNEERGYVLRRIIRRAIRFAYLLGVSDQVVTPLAGRVADVMGSAYPELVENLEVITGVLGREEEQFRRTLKTGMNILDAELAELDDAAVVPGHVAFQLHDTYGFPLEVTSEIAAERGYDVDLDGFSSEMAEQRNRAKAAAKSSGVATGAAAAVFAEVLAEHGTTEFTGRAEDTSKAKILAVVPSDGPGDDDLVAIFLDRSPFYAESGGQLGDTGTITTDTGSAEVLDTTYALPDLHRHIARITSGSITAGQEAVAAIDADRRNAIRRNHTATHLLHWALREVLGDHVKQQGSLVAPDRLRFDFSHFEAMTPDQIRAVEDLANTEVLDNAPARHFETTKEHALAMGAIAFFGEKYGDVVRVLEAGRHSVELCGGTHVAALGDIGLVKIVSETSIGSNLRRIEATTGLGSLEYLRGDEDLLASAAARLGVPARDLVAGIDKRHDELEAARAELVSLHRKLAVARARDLAQDAVDGIVVARVDDLTRDDLRSVAVAIRDEPGISCVVLGGATDTGGAALVVASRSDSGRHAGALVGELSSTLGGGGNTKNAELAMAGGRDAARVDATLAAARVLLVEKP
ncbi:MAG TPA: alanine--tRNA ligase [Acidimicrobiales bacterium]|nr:alanine--tRNA ligase [Acidimicrobiales bacterium]